MKAVRGASYPTFEGFLISPPRVIIARVDLTKLLRIVSHGPGQVGSEGSINGRAVLTNDVRYLGSRSSTVTQS